MKLFVDLESRSPVNLLASGSYKYARHPQTEVLCMALAVDDKPVMLLKPADIRYALPQFKRAALDPSVTFVAHGVHFEFPMFLHVMTRQFGLPQIPAERWDCTLARCVTLGLPGSLEYAALSLNLPHQKDIEGKAALLKICKPIRYDALGDPVYNEDPALYEKVYKYCPQDVEVERAIDKAIPPLPACEKPIFYLDLKINARGVQVDLPLAQKAKALAGTLTADLNARLLTLTKGAVDKATRVASMKTYLAAQGLAVTALDKPMVTALLEKPTVSQHVKDVLLIRRQVGKSSTAKFDAVLEAACDDGRVRGVLQYHGAHTGRWAGRLVQTQNLVKGVKAEEQEKIIRDVFQAGQDVDFAAKYGVKAMDSLANIVRGVFITRPGTIQVGADFSAIEPRVLFWEADDQAALNIYRRGESPYLDMGGYIFKRPITKKDEHPYAVSKMTILGAGYGMGAKRFLDQCAAVGVAITPELAETAIRSYREKYRSVVQCWYATEASAISAVRTPGSVHPAMGGKVLFGMSKSFPDFLACRLPSGRFLWYYKPEVKTVPWFEGEKQELLYWAAVDPQNRSKCLAYDEYKRLGQLKTYGGSLVENITQAIARDLMAHSMLRVEEAGYEVVLHTHDEILAESVEVGSRDVMLGHFIEKMCKTPTWAKGLPVAAEGRTGARYCK